jgi:heme-degrading monooxygenase HmoA
VCKGGDSTVADKLSAKGASFLVWPIAEGSAVPAAKEQKGFHAIYMLESEDEPTVGLALSIWDGKADADAGEQSGYYQEQVQKFASLFTAPPERKGYEVTVSSEE